MYTDMVYVYLNIMDKTHKPAHISPAKRKMRI